MQDHPVIETKRLRLVPVAPEHAAALHAIYADPLAMTFWHTSPHAAVSETQVMVADFITGTSRAWVLMPQGTSQVTGKAGGDVIGLIHYLGEARPGDLAMGYILRADHWRQGLTSEAVAAVLAYGFTSLLADRVELWIDARNTASQGIARHAGFTRRSVFRQKYAHMAESHETHLYGLEIEQWQEGATPRHRPLVPVYGIVPILPVTDVKATAHYYRDVLGFGIDFLAGDPPGYGAVSLSPWSIGPGNIHFKQVATLPPPGSLILRLNIGPGIDALYERYRAAGVEILAEIATQPWGQREFAVADGNGHLLCFSMPA